MSGLKKAKKYDWKDSNLALFGSDVEKNVKKESAKTEKAWKDAGKEVGLQIWRIVKFEVKEWPIENYGKFYNGDTYIILNTYKKEEELLYDVHFWIGKYSTQDEYGTAAYKTVELDTFLDDKPVQHREVQDHESSLFKNYFKNMELLKGGADSGFRKVEATQFKNKLYIYESNGNGLVTSEKSVKEEYLECGDIVAVDIGIKLFVYFHKDIHPSIKFKVSQCHHKIKEARFGKLEIEHYESEDRENLMKELKGIIKEYTGEKKNTSSFTDFQRRFFWLSDERGRLEFKEIHEFIKDVLSKIKKDVFILDCGDECFVECGPEASIDERRKCFQYAHDYLRKTDHPYLPITVMNKEEQTKMFEEAFCFEVKDNSKSFEDSLKTLADVCKTANQTKQKCASQKSTKQ